MCYVSTLLLVTKKFCNHVPLITLFHAVDKWKRLQQVWRQHVIQYSSRAIRQINIVKFDLSIHIRDFVITVLAVLANVYLTV